MAETELTQCGCSEGFWKCILRRRVYSYPFLNRKLQFTFAAILAVIGIGNALYLGILFYFYARETFTLLASYIPEYIQADLLVDQHMRIFLLTSIYIIVPEVLLIVLWGLFFSHRLAGPLFAMNRKLKEIEAGNVPDPVKLRKNDLLTDFADQMNGAIAALANQRENLNVALREIAEGRVKEGQERIEKILHPEPGPATPSPESAPLPS